MIFDKNYNKYLKINDYNKIKLGIPNISNIGWSLGNACPYKCKQCYSRSIRENGKNLTKGMIDRIISQIGKLDVKTINLGGNEPWFTNGLNNNSLLPYILEKLNSKGYLVGITTSGITLINLLKYSPKSLKLINDIDISLDSATEEEHNRNRGADIYKGAIRALEIANEYNIERSIIMCAMNWNFNKENLKKMVELARKYDANIRFNILKPLEEQHMEMMMSLEQFYDGYEYLLNACDTIDITEPRLSSIVNNRKENFCPCGNTSLRIHSITRDGKIYISPCVYMHDFKVGDLLKDDIIDIITSEPFNEMRKRNYYYKDIPGCSDCEKSIICGGGCAAQSYLVNYWKTGNRTLMVHEDNCYKEFNKNVNLDNYVKKVDKLNTLVHINYLCTWIGRPKQ